MFRELQDVSQHVPRKEKKKRGKSKNKNVYSDVRSRLSTCRVIGNGLS